MDPAEIPMQGIEVPLETLQIGTLVVADGAQVLVRELASEVMRLREQALVDRGNIEAEGAGDPVEAAMVWIALTGPKGLPVYLDPTKIGAILANREERD